VPSDSSSSSSSNYSGSSSSSSSNTNGVEDIVSGDPSKYEPRKKVAVSNSYPSSSSSSSPSRLRKCYLSLACLFAMLLLWDSLPQPSPQSQSIEGEAGNGGVGYDDEAGIGGNTNQSSAVLSSVLGGKSGFWGRKSSSSSSRSGLPRASALAGRGKGGAATGVVQKKKKKREALMKLMSFGKHGASPGRFNSPRGLLIVRNRFLLVSDFANKRIQMLFFRSSADLIVDSQSLSPSALMQQSTKMKSAAGGGNGGAGSKEENDEDEDGGDKKGVLRKNTPEPVFEYALEMDQVQ